MVGNQSTRGNASRSGSDDKPLYTFTLRSELRKLSEHALDALEMMRTGEPPKLADPNGPQQILAYLPCASDPKLRDVEIAAQNLVAAIGAHVGK